MVNGVHGVEDVLTIWMIQDEGVCCVEVGDDGDQGGVPKVHAGHHHHLRTTPAKTKILVVVHALYKFTSSLS